MILWAPDKVRDFDFAALTRSLDSETATGEVRFPSEMAVLDGHTSGVRAACFSADGQLLATGSNDNTVRVWSLDTGDCMRSFVDHTGWVRALEVVAPNRIASASDDKTVRVWTLGDGECVRTLVGHTDHVDSLALVSSPSVGWSCTIS